MATYSLGFFLGPGLPRGFAVPFDSNISPRLLLDPGPRLGPFRFLEGSEVLVSPFEGAGVELPSEALSLMSGTFNVEASSTTGAGEDAEDGVGSSSSLAEGGSKRCRTLGDNLRITIFACFLFLSPRLVAVEGDRVVFDDETAIVVGD